MFFSQSAAHKLCVQLIDIAIAKAGNPWRLSKHLGVNHCTLNNLKKHPGRILNGRHVFALIKFIGIETALEIIDNSSSATVEEFLIEKAENKRKNYGNLKLKKIYRDKTANQRA